MYYLYLTSFVYINIFIALHTDDTMDELYAIELELYTLYNNDAAFAAAAAAAKSLQSCSTLETPLTIACQARRLEWIAISFSQLRRIFPAQESNPGLLHCRLILY